MLINQQNLNYSLYQGIEMNTAYDFRFIQPKCSNVIWGNCQKVSGFCWLGWNILSKRKWYLVFKNNYSAEDDGKKRQLEKHFQKFIWKLKQVNANTFFNILLIAKKYFYETYHVKSFYVNYYKFSFVLIFMVLDVS